MGSFYVNYTLRGVKQESVITSLAGRNACVTTQFNDYVVVFDEESDQQNGAVITELTRRLSTEQSCPVLAVLNHDDDILYFLLYDDGEFLDEYDSSPGYFDVSPEDADMFSSPEKMMELAKRPRPIPTGGDARALCEAFNASAVDGVEGILRSTEYAFALERHQQLVNALGLPQFTVGAAYATFARGDSPEGLSKDEIVFTN